MKSFTSTIKGLVMVALIGIISCFVSVSPVSATKAEADKGTGCYVRVGTGDYDYFFDTTCIGHSVIKFDDDGNLAFFSYQDHGQLPDWAWHPSQFYDLTFEDCLDLGPGIGIVCGTVNESVSPSGEYKSSFKSR